jgi:phage baseplate assembly protein gpV
MNQSIKNMLRWARITAPGSDDKQFPTQQMEYLGKVADGAMLFPYGMHGNVPADFLALIGAVQGNPDNRVAIGVLPKDRPTLKDGEVAFYHPPTGALIKWDENGNLLITTGNEGTGNVDVTCKNATVTASESVNITCADATLTASATVDVNCADATVTATATATVTAPAIALTGNVTVTGNLAVTGTMTNAGKDVGKDHGHAQGNDSAGDVQAAISGVT